MKNNKRIEEKRDREIRIINLISSLITQSVPLEYIYQETLNEALEIIEMDAGLIRTVDDETGELILVAHKGHSEDFIKDSLRLKRGESLSWKAVLTGKTVMMDGDLSIYPDSPRKSVIEREGIRSIIIVPFKGRERVIGILSTASKEIRSFSRQDIQFISSLGNLIGAAIENARHIEEIGKKNQQILSLHEISKKITSLSEKDNLLSLIAEETAKLLGTDGAGFRVIEGNFLVIGGRSGLPEPVSKHEKVKIGEGRSGRVAAENRPLVINDVRNDPALEPREREEAAFYGYCSYAGVPLRIRDRVIGVLSVYSKAPRIFTADDIRIMETYADYAAIAIENLRLYNDINNKNTQLRSLIEISKYMIELRNLDLTLSLIIESAVKFIKANTYNLRLLNEKNELVIAKSYRASIEYQREGQILHPGEGLAGTCIAEGKPIISEDISTDSRLKFKDLHLKEGTRSIVAIPMKIEDKIIGSLSFRFGEVKKFSEEEISILTMFVNLAANCVNNSRIYEEMERAYSDLKRMQEEIINSEKLSAIGRLAYNVAHYVNNVFAVIMGHAQLSLMTEEGISDKLKNRLEKIEEISKKTSRLIYQLQQFGDIDKSIKKEVLEINLNQLIQEVIEFIEPLIRKQEQEMGISLEVSTNLSQIPEISGNLYELKEVLINIIVNAIEASTEGGRIYISSRFESGNIIIEICDEGVGISEEDKKKVFDPFFTTKGLSHTGLGLSTTYSIIKRYDGEILISPYENKGTKISINLPVYNKN